MQALCLYACFVLGTTERMPGRVTERLQQEDHVKTCRLDYEDVLRRVRALCVGEAPAGSSVTGACAHMARLAEEQLPTARVLTWDERDQILEIPDPYLSFYLRWSERLQDRA